jgi:hypothetical protein
MEGSVLSKHYLEANKIVFDSSTVPLEQRGVINEGHRDSTKCSAFLDRERWCASRRKTGIFRAEPWSFAIWSMTPFSLMRPSGKE